MRDFGASLSVSPRDATTVYLVLDDFGKFGRAYLETDEEKADFGTVTDGLLTGQYKKPLRVVAFNTSEGWARDASTEVAWEVVKRATAAGEQLTSGTLNFVQSYIAERVGLEA